MTSAGASTRASTDATTKPATVMMADVMTTVMAMVNTEDAEQELQDEKRAAGRRTTQEYPHHTTYTRFKGRRILRACEIESDAVRYLLRAHGDAPVTRRYLLQGGVIPFMRA